MKVSLTCLLKLLDRKREELSSSEGIFEAKCLAFQLKRTRSRIPGRYALFDAEERISSESVVCPSNVFLCWFESRETNSFSFSASSDCLKLLEKRNGRQRLVHHLFLDHKALILVPNPSLITWWRFFDRLRDVSQCLAPMHLILYILLEIVKLLAPPSSRQENDVVAFILVTKSRGELLLEMSSH